MKRMIAFIFLLPILFAINLQQIDKYKNLDYQKVTIVSKVENLIEDCQVVKNGQVFYFTLDRNVGKSILSNLPQSQVEGIIYYLSKEHSIDYFKNLYGQYLSNVSYIEGMNIYYAYDNTYHDFRYINNKKVNVQIAYTCEGWVVGYPAIITGF